MKESKYMIRNTDARTVDNYVARPIKIRKEISTNLTEITDMNHQLEHRKTALLYIGVMSN